MSELPSLIDRETQLATTAAFFEGVENLPEDQIIAGFNQLPLPPQHIDALTQSAMGNRSEIDKLLRSDEAVKVWFVPIDESLGSPNRYAWVVAESDELGLHMKDVAACLHNTALNSDLLRPGGDFPDRATPPIIWIKPFKSSELPRPLAEDGSDEFYIFQTPKAENEELIDDFDQELVINGELVDRLAAIGIERLKQLFVIEGDALGELEKHSSYYARVHLEGHNQGHFVGPWPLDRKKKDHESYDFIEELRACLTAVAMLDGQTEISSVATEALALQILTTRLLVHGKTAYDLGSEQRTRQQVRELIVPAILFERARRDGAILPGPDKYLLRPSLLVQSMLNFLAEIHATESLAFKTRSSKLLHEFTIERLKDTFPMGNYSPHLKTILENTNDGTYN